MGPVQVPHFFRRKPKAPPFTWQGFCFSALGHSDHRVANVQDFHPVGAADGVVAVALGQDDPVTGLHHAALDQLIHRRLADFARLQGGRVERHGVDATEHGGARLGFAVRENA